VSGFFRFSPGMRITDVCTRRYTRYMRTSVHIDDELAAEARELDINVSQAARDGLRRAVRRRRAELDRQAYQAKPETEDAVWDEAEAWGEP
jgi:post-segregation antitoxin (ccd killing protein)